MITLLNPTGKPIRSDAAGDGHYGAKRGIRLHKGIDLLCDPGQDVVSPLQGFVMRIAFPYADDLAYKGIVIQGEWCRIKIFYVEPFVGNGVQVYRGQPIAKAQNVALRYGGDMRPHVHLEFEEIIPNPEFFIEV